MLNLWKIVILAGMLVLLSACSAKNQLTPQGESVRIYNALPAQMNCEYKEEIIGSEGTFLDYLFISNRDLTAGARADLRNQASKLGANVVVIQKAEFVYVTSTVFIGQAYDCR